MGEKFEPYSIWPYGAAGREERNRLLVTDWSGFLGKFRVAWAFLMILSNILRGDGELGGPLWPR